MKSAILMTLLFVTLVLFLACSKNKHGNHVSIKGSDTMVHLASDWAQHYMKKNEAKLSVTGGGSGTGIAALLNRSTNIAISSRKIKEKEKAAAVLKGLKFKEIPIATDGVSVIINPLNPIKKLTLEQIEKIYTGVYRNWKQLGGPDLLIVPFSRESSSGTFSFFQKKAMSKKDYHNSISRLPSNSLILNTVASNKGAIGYVGLGYYLKSRGKVDAVSLNGVFPTVETVKSKAYLLSRNLLFYVNETKLNKATSNFIQFVLSPEGQMLVTTAGFVAIK